MARTDLNRSCSATACLTLRLLLLLELLHFVRIACPQGCVVGCSYRRCCATALLAAKPRSASGRQQAAVSQLKLERSCLSSADQAPPSDRSLSCTSSNIEMALSFRCPAGYVLGTRFQAHRAHITRHAAPCEGIYSGEATERSVRFGLLGFLGFWGCRILKAFQSKGLRTVQGLKKSQAGNPSPPRSHPCKAHSSRRHSFLPSICRPFAGGFPPGFNLRPAPHRSPLHRCPPAPLPLQVGGTKTRESCFEERGGDVGRRSWETVRVSREGCTKRKRMLPNRLCCHVSLHPRNQTPWPPAAILS